MNVKPERGGVEPAQTLKAAQSEATRATLIATARELFATRGYSVVGTEEIVRAAGVTRGALYHHFAGKRELFEAVYEDVERQLVERIAASAISSAGDPLQALLAGSEAFLDACEDPAVQRIALLDAPSVLGWERWREIGMRYGFGLVQATVQAAMDAGLIEQQPVQPLSHLLLGAMDEGAMLIARSEDAGQTRREVGASMARFLEALRPRE
ncbi:MAG TPA: TetR/AcrR family transcriptional regulator [Solirubrobacteraceae bacterium]|jgi:AcrR family transcriptional regulator|nr:TetR/AcrR family transcriptional regulator [Solirubrobacteraceae bacterium]